MVRRLALLLLSIFFSCLCVFAQKVKTVSAEYTYYAPETMSVEEAKRTALDQAKIQAIAEEFGMKVSQTSSIVMSSQNGDADERFFSVGGSEVKGEWIETLGQPKFEVTYDNHLLVVTVKMKGKIRELLGNQAQLKIIPLRNGTELRFASTEFHDEDFFYLLFSSPEDGWLSVWLSDDLSDTVYRLLPYQLSKESVFRVTANKQYIFFSQKHSHDYDNSGSLIVDEFNMTADNEVDFNNLYVVFSPNAYSLPVLSKRDGIFEIDRNKFEKWISKTRLKDNQTVAESFLLTVTK